MTLTIRRIIFYSFCLIFLIVTPTIILYASGHKIDWRNLFTPLAVQKTGMIIVYSEPAGAKISLNEEKQMTFLGGWLEKILPNKDFCQKTPARIKNLLPGIYDLRVELPGYWPWTRRITIFPTKITHVLDINLFRQTEPIKIISMPPQTIYLAPNNKKIFLPVSGLLLDLKTEKAEKIIAENKAPSAVLWSTDGEKILLEKSLINLKNPEKNLDLEKIIGSQIFNLKWNGEMEKIYYQYKNAVNRFDLGNQADETIIKEEKILDYIVKGKELFCVVENGLSITLKFYNLNDKKIIKKLDLPFSEGYRLINPNSKLLNLYDEKYHTLYLIDPSSAANPLLETIEAVKKTEWINDKILIWANDFEIWTLNLEKNEKRLIARWSLPIENIIKTKTENYILFATAKTVNAITWAIGDEIQVTELISLDKISSPVFDASEKNLYFTAAANGEEGLYKLVIQ